MTRVLLFADVAQTLATEAVTSEYADANDGLPHTLEHMIFLGSELYPYKGVLDQLANRCLAGVRPAASERGCSRVWRQQGTPRVTHVRALVDRGVALMGRVPTRGLTYVVGRTTPDCVSG